MKNQLIKKFRYIDIFGYTVNWKFDGNDSHKTIVGSIMSLLVMAMTFAQFYQKFVRMINYEG